MGDCMCCISHYAPYIHHIHDAYTVSDMLIMALCGLVLGLIWGASMTYLIYHE